MKLQKESLVNQYTGSKVVVNGKFINTHLYAVDYVKIKITVRCQGKVIGTKTVSSGVITVRTMNTKSVLTDKITITNGAGRTMYLKKLNISNGKWYTKNEYQLEDTDEPQHIIIEYPEQWSDTTYATWKISIPELTDNEENKVYEAEEAAVKTIAYNRYSLSLKAKSACILDENGYVIYSKKSGVKRAMASTTKLMTATLAIESGKLDKTVTVSKWAANTPWRNLFLKTGEKFKMRSLMHALLICSSNESANVIAQSVGQTEKKFVSRMNKRAQELGLTNTHYCNAHGLDAEGQYSTAKDVTKLLMHIFRK